MHRQGVSKQKPNDENASLQFLMQKKRSRSCDAVKGPDFEKKKREEKRRKRKKRKPKEEEEKRWVGGGGSSLPSVLFMVT